MSARYVPRFCDPAGVPWYGDDHGEDLWGAIEAMEREARKLRGRQLYADVVDHDDPERGSFTRDVLTDALASCESWALPYRYRVVPVSAGLDRYKVVEVWSEHRGECWREISSYGGISEHEARELYEECVEEDRQTERVRETRERNSGPSVMGTPLSKEWE